MLKIRNRSICNLLVIIFRSFLEKREVLLSMKKSQCGSLKKRARDENLPISSLSVSNKMFDSMPRYFTENGLILHSLKVIV